MLFSPAYLSTDFLTRLTQGVFKGTAVVIFFLFSHVAHINSKKVILPAVHPVQKERKVDAQPLKQRAFTEVAEPALHGACFIISIMAAVLFVF